MERPDMLPVWIGIDRDHVAPFDVRGELCPAFHVGVVIGLEFDGSLAAADGGEPDYQLALPFV